MPFTKVSIMSMTEDHARAISLWKYEGVYAFYDHSEGNVSGYMDGTHFACVDGDAGGT